MRLKVWNFLLPVLLCMFLFPAKALAGQTVGNLVILVDFEQDLDSGGNPVANEFTEGRQISSGFYGWSSVGKTIPDSVSYCVWYRDIYTAAQKSLPDYISTISDGQVTVNSYFPQENSDGTVTTITLPGKAADYEGNSGSSGDGAFLAAVLEKMKNTTFPTQLSASQLDTWKGSDGYIDNLTILVQATQTGAYISHKNDYGGGETVCFGLKVGAYNIISTEALRGNGYSVASHEFLHTLGAPDLYRTSGGGTPVGPWDNQATVSPYALYPLVYTRSQLGWLSIPTVTESGDYTLNRATANSGNRAFILKTDRSSSEYFVIEYRPGSASTGEYDYFGTVQSGGLIVYRVNENVEGKTNAGGQNYIYVFRPGTAQDHASASETFQNGDRLLSNTYRAAFGYSERPSLGSSDLTASCTANTIFYSDGTNSGIVIDNVVLNGDTASFHISFPDLDESVYWTTQDEAVAGASQVALEADETNGILYMVCLEGNSIQVYSNGLAGGGWSKLGSSVRAYSSTAPALKCLGGKLYLAYLDSNGMPCVVTWNGSSWTDCKQGSAQYANKLQMVEYNGALWLAYITANGNELEVWNPSTGAKKTQLTVPSLSIGNPAVCVYAGELYAVYSDYFSLDAKSGKVAKYSESTGSWNVVYTLTGISTVQSADIYSDSGKIRAFATDGNKNYELLTYTSAGGWCEETLAGVGGANGISLEEKGGIPYLFWCDNTVLKVMYKSGSTWTTMEMSIATDVLDFDTACLGGVLYVGNTSSAGVTVRKMQTVNGEAAVIPTDPNRPAVGQYEVVITVPTQYDPERDIYIDGVEYTSTPYGTDASNRLVSIGNGDAQTAIMYLYNQNNIPTGMYVWRLKYADGAYTAAAVPELENLLSYNGFAVRYMGETGLRCVSGIETEKKSKLKSSSGLAGYRLVELGTLIMHPDNRKNYPLVYGSDMVAGGRTYYTKGGKTYDQVISTSGGRDLFANVLIGLPVDRYATDYVFRSYAVLDDGGTSIVLYGAEMSRSMYTVCKQVLASGSYATDSDAYKFLQGIVDVVDNR